MMRSYLPPRLWISVASRYDRGTPKGVGVVGVGVYGSGSPKGVRVVRGCRRRGVVLSKVVDIMTCNLIGLDGMPNMMR